MAKKTKSKKRAKKTTTTTTTTKTVKRVVQKNDAATGVAYLVGLVTGYAIPKVIEGTQLRLADYGPNHFVWRGSGDDRFQAVRKGRERWRFEVFDESGLIASKNFRSNSFDRGVQWATDQLNKGRKKNPAEPGMSEAELMARLKF